MLLLDLVLSHSHPHFCVSLGIPPYNKVLVQKILAQVLFSKNLSKDSGVGSALRNQTFIQDKTLGSHLWWQTGCPQSLACSHITVAKLSNWYVVNVEGKISVCQVAAVPGE